MASNSIVFKSIVFKIHYGGRFDRSNGRSLYVDGKMAMHPDPYDCDYLSFIEGARKSAALRYIHKKEEEEGHFGDSQGVLPELVREEVALGGPGAQYHGAQGRFNKWGRFIGASELGGPELAELGGHSFDVGGPSFEVGGPSVGHMKTQKLQIWRPKMKIRGHTSSITQCIQIPHLRDEETPSQSTGEPLSVPLTRSRRLSQLLSGIVEVNDNAVAAVRPRAETPYKEAPAAESLQMHPARKNPPSTRSIVAATGIASRIRMRTSSRLQKFGSQGGSTSTPVVIDLTASKGAGVRCSWGPPGRGGVQFRVSQPPLGSGAADNDKAPLTKSKGVKDKGKKPRWQI
ncbi:hypothetical protein CJ030_MR6G024337 [Morella rubra]|uniref:Uncharacterized protein n=1 Tax=Morella rubra TaxID=262757 RepID=A0A6A1V8W0_9ROSI|nr:hypothetical protein CJ030_MR6G024337 [Morella rubra]